MAGNDVEVGRIGQGLDRLVYFSDAVMAIALTLLALELPVPTGDSEDEVWDSFVDHLTPDYLSFALSFVVIAAFWTGHHFLFARIGRLGHGLIWRNFGYLFLVVIMPFATKLLNDTDSSLLGTVLYAAAVAGVGLIRIEMLRHARRTGLLRPGIKPGYGGGMTVVTFAFGLSIPLAFINVGLAQYSWIAFTVVAGLVLRRLARRGATAGRTA